VRREHSDSLIRVYRKSSTTAKVHSQEHDVQKERAATHFTICVFAKSCNDVVDPLWPAAEVRPRAAVFAANWSR